MKEFTYTIKEPVGIHARPAGMLAKEAKTCQSTVTIVDKNGKSVDATRLMALMGMGIKCGDTVTVNYHGVVWGKDTPFDSSFDRHQPASFGIGVGQVIKGWDQTVPGHNVGSRLVVSIPPEYGYGSRGIPQAGIGGEDTLVFVIDIISTR